MKEHWPTIKSVFQDAKKTSKHCAIASVSDSGAPHITPIGSLFLRDNFTGYYFEEYSQKMSHNFKSNDRVCILALNSGFRYWIRSLISGRFPTPPGVRLYGRVGQRRMGTAEEIASFQNRVRFARKLKGYKLIWKNMRHVREIHFDSFEPVNASKMTQHLWG